MLGGGGDEVSVMPFFYPCGKVSVLSLNYFRQLVHHINLLILTFLSLLEYTSFKSISRRIEGGSDNTSSHRKRRPGTRSRGIK